MGGFYFTPGQTKDFFFSTAPRGNCKVLFVGVGSTGSKFCGALAGWEKILSFRSCTADIYAATGLSVGSGVDVDPTKDEGWGLCHGRKQPISVVRKGQGMSTPD